MTEAVDNQNYLLANRSTHYDDTVLICITKKVKNVVSQMKKHFIYPGDLSSTIDFLVTLEHACDTNCIHEGTAMLVLLYLVKNALDCIVPSVQSAEPQRQKLLRR